MRAEEGTLFNRAQHPSGLQIWVCPALKDLYVTVTLSSTVRGRHNCQSGACDHSIHFSEIRSNVSHTARHPRSRLHRDDPQGLRCTLAGSTSIARELGKVFLPWTGEEPEELAAQENSQGCNPGQERMVHRRKLPGLSINPVGPTVLRPGPTRGEETGLGAGKGSSTDKEKP